MSAFFLPFAFSLIFTKLAIFISRNYIKKYQPIRLDGPQSHLIKKNTPIFGGVAVLLSILISNLFLSGIVTALLLTVVCLPFFLLGLWDDVCKIKTKTSKGISGYLRFIIELGICSIFFIVFRQAIETWVIIPIPFYKTYLVDLGLYYYPIAVLMMVSVINSVNLTDGLDGLASFHTIIILLASIVLSFLLGNSLLLEENIILIITIFSTLIGFLLFNSYPAKIFLGESGSLLVGFLLALVLVLLKIEFTVIITGIFLLLETLSVIIQVLYFKFTKGRRFFRMAPLHHHFELYNIHESKILINSVIFSICISLFYILSIKLPIVNINV